MQFLEYILTYCVAVNCSPDGDQFKAEKNPNSQSILFNMFEAILQSMTKPFRRKDLSEVHHSALNSIFLENEEGYVNDV